VNVSSGTGSPGKSRIKGRKTVVVLVVVAAGAGLVICLKQGANAYGSADVTDTPSSLASLKSRFNLSGAGLLRMSWKTGR